MRILILSSQKELFEGIPKGLDVHLLAMNQLDLLQGEYRMAYIDQMDKDCKSQCRNTLKELKAIADIPWGVIDFKRKLKDPLELIFHGWADYLCGKDLLKRFTAARLQDVLYFHENKQPIPLKKQHILEGTPSGENWEKVQEDHEYIFGMLYVEAVPDKNMEAQLGERGIEQLQKEWQKLLQDFFDPWFGYNWINNGWASVILFPFNGKKLHAIEAAMEFYLNSPIFRYPSYTHNLKYRQVLHLSKTLYRNSDNTSNIISEALNDLFHMGLYHAVEGNFYLTDPAMIYLPESLHNIVEESRDFEGHIIHNFKLPY
ncbi:MAG: hypothetical protein PF447_13215 [Spirochaetaceae bacterium]|jgi:hypothetical protein|nr:hypothetical protein [Spirochaetaceae bacterium]